MRYKLQSLNGKHFITVPKWIVNFFDLHKGDEFDFMINECGEILLVKKEVKNNE